MKLRNYDYNFSAPRAPSPRIAAKNPDEMEKLKHFITFAELCASFLSG